MGCQVVGMMMMMMMMMLLLLLLLLPLLHSSVFPPAVGHIGMVDWFGAVSWKHSGRRGSLSLFWSYMFDISPWSLEISSHTSLPSTIVLWTLATHPGPCETHRKSLWFSCLIASPVCFWLHPSICRFIQFRYSVLLWLYIIFRYSDHFSAWQGVRFSVYFWRVSSILYEPAQDLQAEAEALKKGDAMKAVDLTAENWDIYL